MSRVEGMRVWHVTAAPADDRGLVASILLAATAYDWGRFQMVVVCSIVAGSLLGVRRPTA